MPFLTSYYYNPGNKEEWFELYQIVEKIWFEGELHKKFWACRTKENRRYVDDATHEIGAILNHLAYLCLRWKQGDNIDYKDMVRSVQSVFLYVAGAEVFVEYQKLNIGESK